MKKTFFLLFISLSMITISCSKKCSCSNNWNPNTIYNSGDLVSHNGKCWEAFSQGGGSIVEPGTSGGDIWEECKN